ncbi:MAG: hypothetical protein HYT61_03875 [Candidatus Yanofskybacteria bacterium]|nr:hypothetical protein [Candidatus Yanofskybacteria bacterium]
MKKRTVFLVVFLSVFGVLSAVAQMETPSDIRDRLGIYHWGGVHLAVANEPLLDGAERVKESGSRVINIVLSPYSDYKLGERFETSSLTLRARRSDYTAVLCDPGFSTVVITAFDWATYPTMFRNLPQDPVLRSQLLEIVSAEFADLVLYVATVCNGQTKNIIIKDWEVENSLQINISSLDPDINKTVQWQSYLDYIEARQRGVLRGRERAGEAGSSVKFFNAVETANVVGLLNNQLEKSVLWQMAQRGLVVDLVSFSSWQSMWRSGTGTTPLDVYLRVKNDAGKILDFIKANGIAEKLFIGEFGIHYTYEADLLRYAYDAISENSDIVLAVKWNLYNTDEGWLGFFGDYDGSGNMTQQGAFMKEILGDRLPRINVGGVIDNATHERQTQSGSIIEIYGNNLPEEIGSTRVQLTVNGASYAEAEILYTSAGQINARLPVLPELEGKTAYIRVNNSNFQPIFIGAPGM